MVLYKVRSAECFEHLRTVDGVLHPTLKSTSAWALAEASTWAFGKKLRNMFCTMLMHVEVTNPLDLWEHHWRSLTDDLQYRIRNDVWNMRMHIDNTELKILGLVEIELILDRNSQSLKKSHQWNGHLLKQLTFP